MAVEGGPHRRAGRSLLRLRQARAAHAPFACRRRATARRAAPHVEPDVAACDAARRVPVRDAEARERGRPSATSPIDVPYNSSAATTTNTPAYAVRKRERQRNDARAAARPSRPRRRAAAAPSVPASPQPIDADRRDGDERPRRDDRSEREPAEIHEPVRRRDEERQVVQPVAVDAPDERARRPRRSSRRRPRRAPARARSGRAGAVAASSTTHVTAPSASCPSSPTCVSTASSAARYAGPARGVPARDGHRRYWTSRQLGVGSSSSSARPPWGSW